jgi:nitrite reductase (NO-forming)
VEDIVKANRLWKLLLLAFLPLAGWLGAETVQDAVLTTAPDMPPAIGSRGPVTLKVVLTIEEKNVSILHGVEKDTLYPAWTFNGTAPGPMIRAKEGDTLELHLINPKTSRMAHNIDLHAVSGPGGGAPATLAQPGEEKVARFKLLNPGLFVYHCAAPPVTWHIANGMYGMILVEPKKGLPAVDKEFYVLQSEFYTKNPFGSEGLQEFDNDAAEAEKPTYVVFNGSASAFTAANPLKVKVGDRVRVYFGNAGPNLTASWHIIGVIFEKLWAFGSTAAPLEDVQTVSVPAGGSAIADFKIKVPGNYTFVDHAIFRIQKGALGILHADGDANPEIYPAAGK